MVSTASPFAPDEVAAAGLVLVGEPLALDLANTVKLVTDPPTELLTDEQRHAAFWALQAHRLPDDAEAPDPEETIRLRGAVRSVVTSHLGHAAFEPSAVATINTYAASAPSAPQLVIGNGLERRTTWASDNRADLTLAAVARSAIDVVTGPAADRLRSCGSDKCSMVFVATNAKRRWCSSAVCGNRERVARHAHQARLAHHREEKS